jgi:hypothetical protein
MCESLTSKKVALPSAGNTQQDLFDYRVIAHEVTATVLCDCHALKARGMMMTTESPVKIRKTYAQEWPAYNQAQTNEKARLQTLLFELCAGIQEPMQTFGRPRLSFAEMIFAAVFKVYSTVSGRRFISDLREAQKRGYISKTPHFNSISNYLELESMTPYLKQLIAESSLPLKSIESDFAVDSSGFATGQFSRWFDAKYGEPKQQHQWLKVHLLRIICARNFYCQKGSMRCQRGGRLCE